jgi:hypothetical protein
MFRNNFIAGTHLIKLCDQSQSNLFKQPKFFSPIADILVSTLFVIFVDFVAKKVQYLLSSRFIVLE